MNDRDSPQVIVIAGPNGSGKSTAAPTLLRDYLGVTEFVNADVIALGLSAYGSENVAIQAGRIMLKRLDELTAERSSFAFETTLASRSFASRIQELTERGYQSHLLYLWLPTPEIAVSRVKNRVLNGGHNIPEEVVRRRYFAGLENLFNLYRPLVDYWRLYDNSQPYGYELIAKESKTDKLLISQMDKWNQISKVLQ